MNATQRVQLRRPDPRRVVLGHAAGLVARRRVCVRVDDRAPDVGLRHAAQRLGRAPGRGSRVLPAAGSVWQEPQPFATHTARPPGCAGVAGPPPAAPSPGRRGRGARRGAPSSPPATARPAIATPATASAAATTVARPHAGSAAPPGRARPAAPAVEGEHARPRRSATRAPASQPHASRRRRHRPGPGRGSTCAATGRAAPAPARRSPPARRCGVSSMKPSRTSYSQRPARGNTTAAR